MIVTRREQDLSEIEEIIPKQYLMCGECFDKIKQESMWSKEIHGIHGVPSLAFYCKKCYPTKESILEGR